MAGEAKRPMEGWYLRDALKKLAEIQARSFSLGQDLAPLEEEDIAAGAEPLTHEQIMEELNIIQRLATSLALEELQATSAEWYAATDAIE